MFDALNRDLSNKNPYGRLSRRELEALDARLGEQIGASYMHSAANQLSARVQLSKAASLTTELAAVKRELSARDLRWKRQRGVFFGILFFVILGFALLLLSVLTGSRTGP